MLRRICYVCVVQITLLVSLSVLAVKPKPLVFNGDTLPVSSDFKRSQCGKLCENLAIPEVSGIACSRVTPGYIWMQSDETAGYIIATTQKGDSCYTKVKFTKKIRWDWEDMSGGVYEDKNYLFIGAFGDNNETDGDYHIVYFEEPAIDPENPTVQIKPSDIRYIYPDSLKHNAEALMYDNVEQVIYIITKVYYNVCQVFSLPFRTDYGSEVQKLTYVCDLGVRSDIGFNKGGIQCLGFHLVTAADISPDGKYVLIKNHNNISGFAAYSWVLYWEREEGENIAKTVQRQPVVLDCYQSEWQGEAICWLDSDVFYTTSDSDGEPPIYKYARKGSQDIESVTTQPKNGNTLVLIDGNLYIRTKEGLYTIDGKIAGN